jgi:hypothetical protein
MTMTREYEQKTQPTATSVDAFLEAIEDDARRKDAIRLREVMEDISGEPAVMWGPSIVGFGRYHYRYATGHEGEAAAVGFSPRKANLTIYITGGFDGQDDALARLGPHKLGKGCLYLKRLCYIDEPALRQLIQASLDNAARFHVEP